MVFGLCRKYTTSKKLYIFWSLQKISWSLQKIYNFTKQMGLNPWRPLGWSCLDTIHL